MRQSDAINWGAAILLSLLVHGMIFLGGSPRTGEKNPVASMAPIVTRVNFHQSLHDTEPDEPHQIKKQPPRQLKKIEAEPARAKSAAQEPAEPKPVVPQQESVEKTEPVRQAAAEEQTREEHVSHLSKGLSLKERQLYLHKLMSHIESFKYYPRSARMRSLQGEVKVSFILLDNGYYKQLKLDGPHSVLVKATRSAMESAVPFPSPPEGMILPGQLELTMSYSLTQ